MVLENPEVLASQLVQDLLSVQLSQLLLGLLWVQVDLVVQLHQLDRLDHWGQQSQVLQFHQRFPGHRAIPMVQASHLVQEDRHLLAFQVCQRGLLVLGFLSDQYLL